MSSPTVEGGRPLLRGRLFGFPVHLDLSFVIIMGVLGYGGGGPSQWRNLLIWLLVTPVAVLTHELGHAFLARAAGARPEIALAGFGGVTSYVPPRPLSRGRQLSISLAGPAVGLVLGFALLFVWHAVEADLPFGGWQEVALKYGIWTCLGWSVLNLLPILPLDGGQALRELLPGAPAVRERRAAYVSVVVAVLAAGLAYLSYQQVFLAVFLLFFAVSNVMTIRAGAQPTEDATEPAARLGGSPEQAVIDQLWLGRPAQAREVLAARSEHQQVDPAIHGAVLAVTGDPAQGRAILDQELARRPGDTTPPALLALTLTLQHDWDALIALLQGPVGALVPRPVVDRAIEEARGTGQEGVAGRLTYLTRPDVHP